MTLSQSAACARQGTFIPMRARATIKTGMTRRTTVRRALKYCLIIPPPSIVVCSYRQDNVVVLDVHVVALRDKGPLDQFVAVLHRNVVFAYLEPARIAVGLSGPD